MIKNIKKEHFLQDTTQHDKSRVCIWDIYLNNIRIIQASPNPSISPLVLNYQYSKE